MELSLLPVNNDDDDDGREATKAVADEEDGYKGTEG